MAHDLELYDGAPANPYDNLPTVQPPMNSFGNAFAVANQFAEIQGQMTIAQNFPRDEQKCAEAIRVACSRATLAEVATFEYKRGGQKITGETIHLAKAMAALWKNITYSWVELERIPGDATTPGVSTVRTWALDLQNNVSQAITVKIPHSRAKSNGTVDILRSERDIYEHIANHAARRMRSCILALIPQDVRDMAVAQVDETMRLNYSTKPDEIKKLLDAFEAFGVCQAQIEKYIQRKITTIEPAQVANLRRIYLSLRSGYEPKTWFDMEVAEQTSATDDLKNRLAFQGARNTAPITSAESEPAKNTSEQKNATDGESGTPEKSGKTPATKKTPKKEPQQPQTVEGIYRQAIADAKTAEDLNGVDEGMKADDRLDDKQRDSLRLYLEQRYEEV